MIEVLIELAGLMAVSFAQVFLRRQRHKAALDDLGRALEGPICIVVIRSDIAIDVCIRGTPSFPPSA
jgi:hypothetical protein